MVFRQELLTDSLTPRGPAGAIGNEDNRSPARFPEEVKESTQTNRCRCVQITGPTSSDRLEDQLLLGIDVGTTASKAALFGQPKAHFRLAASLMGKMYLAIGCLAGAG